MYPDLGSIYLRFQTKLCDHSGVLRLISTELSSQDGGGFLRRFRDDAERRKLGVPPRVFNVFWIASHGRVLAAEVASQFIVRSSYAVKVLFSGGFTVRSPGSWLGGSWVSALVIVSLVFAPSP